MGDSKTNTLYYLTLPLKLCTPLHHIKFRSLYKWPSFPFINFQHYKFSYWIYVLYQSITLRNTKTNGRSSSNISIRCKQSVPTYRLLFRTSLWIATLTFNVILQQFEKFITLIGYSCVENSELYFHILGPFDLWEKSGVTPSGDKNNTQSGKASSC